MSVLSELEKKLDIQPLSFETKESIEQVNEDVQSRIKQQNSKQSKNISKQSLSGMIAEGLQKKLKQSHFDKKTYASKWGCSTSIVEIIITFLRQIDLNKLNESDVKRYKALVLGILNDNIEYKELKKMAQVLKWNSLMG